MLFVMSDSILAQEPLIGLPDSVLNSSSIYIEKGDTLYDVPLPEVLVSRKKYKAKSLTPQERRELWRLIRDVKRTLPYAKLISQTLIETYEYVETFPDEKSRRKHIKRVEKDLKKEYTPQMKKLTLRQGKLLIKLVDRQCNQSSYHIVRAFFGGWKAMWWNVFAHFYGTSLKTRYRPDLDKEDALIERIVLLVEEHRI